MLSEYTPVVSLILPVFNVETYIAECIRSVISQNFKNFELIVVDDKSDDQSLHIAMGLLSSSEINFRIISHSERQGVSAARNTGIKAAQGEYLAFVDGDDWLEENFLQKMVAEIPSHPGEIISGNTMQYLNGEFFPFGTHVSEKTIFSCEACMERMLYSNGYTDTSWAKIFPKKLFSEHDILFPDQPFFEDTLMHFELLKYVNSVIVLPEVVYFYRINRPGSIITEKNFNSFTLKLQALERLYDFAFEKSSINKKIIQEFYLLRLVMEFRNIFGTYGLSGKQKRELSLMICSKMQKAKPRNKFAHFHKLAGLKFSFLLNKSLYRKAGIFVALHNSYYSIISFLIEL